MVKDNVPIVCAGRDLKAGETITLGVVVYTVGMDAPKGTLLYTDRDGLLRPLPGHGSVTPP